MASVTLVNLNRVTIPPVAPYAIDILASALVDARHDVETLDLCGAADPERTIAAYFRRERRISWA